jgi:MFS family permease
MGVGVAIVAMVHHYSLYALGFALTGAGYGVAFTMSSYYALSLSEIKGKGSGMMETLVGGGSLLGPLYGGAIGSALGPRVGVYAGLVPLAFLFGWAMLKPDGIRGDRPGNENSIAA